MKKTFYYAMMSAIALTSAVGFTACSSDNDAVAGNNPTFDGNSVRTDFAFNITKASQGTRMTATNVQESGTFRGLEKMFLLPFTGVPGTATTSNAASFDLGTLSGIANPTSSKVYALTIPVGTNNFLFYGVADRGSQENYQVGKVTCSLTADTNPVGIAGIHFDLTSIADLNKDTNGSTVTNNAVNLATYLTQVASAKATLSGTLGEKTWAWTETIAETDGNFRALARLYNKFTTIGASEARSGSAESVKRLMLDLYKSAKAINDESSNADVQAMAAAICTAITTATSNGVKVNILQADGTTAVDFAANNTANGDPDTWKSTLVGLTGASVYGDATGKQVNDIFPANLGLPMGAAQLLFSSGAFSYNTSVHAGNSTTPGQLVVNVGDIDYPAELLYFDNSPLLATSKYKEVSDYPTTTANWDAALGGTGAFDTDWTKNSSVTATTRAVAMQNNVNYGVALFKTNVKLGTPTAPATGFTDNMATIVGGSAENQTNIDGTKFKVTGILIGGQPKKIGWDMIRKDESGNNFDQVIYDRDVQYGAALSTDASANNYTIVYDNYDSDNTQDPVLFALEIVNGDKDFYGKDNLIPANSTFYLVGKLTPASPSDWAAKVTAAARPASYRITNESVSRIFVQDYTTIANITLNAATALQNAYSTIPDLRSSETVFGLSVDLKWEAGIEFDVTIQ
jgi:hypothetical protein